MSVGSRMKERRESLGMTQIQLAELLGVTKGAIGNYETDANSPKASILYKVFEVLKCDANYLFQDEIRERREYTASPHEMEHLVKKYRLLDHEWQEAVDSVLDIGYRQYQKRQEEERVSSILREQREQTEAAEEIAPPITLHQPYAQVAAAEGAGAFLLDDGFDEVLVEINKYTKQADVILKVVGRSMEPVIADGDRVLVRQQPSVRIGEIGVFIVDGQGYLKEYQADRLVSLNPDIDDVLVGDLQSAECYGKFIKVLNPDWVK